MKLNMKPIKKNSTDYEFFKKVQTDSFPAVELFPMWMLHLIAKKKSASYLGIYDGAEPVGLIFFIESPKMVFLLYIAIFEKVRSMHYGSEVIEWLKDYAGERPVAGNAEAPEPGAAKDAQSVRRLAFYKRHGIVQSGWGCKSAGVQYVIISSGKELDVEEFRRLAASTVFGLAKPTVYEI